MTKTIKVHNEVAVEAQSVSKELGGKRVLNNVSFSVDNGRVLSILGHNGAGKSTLLRIITTLSLPQPGAVIKIAGRDVIRHPREARRHFGTASQASTLDGLLSGRQNLQMIAQLRGMSRRQARTVASSSLRAVGLEGVGNRPVSTYSGGMTRRLDLTSALLGQPRVLFLDEPTVGIDPEARRAIWKQIKIASASGTCVVLTTQHLDEAEALSDEILILRDGHVVANGSPEKLKQRVSSEHLDVTFATGTACAEARNSLHHRFQLHDTSARTISLEIPRGVEDATRALQAVAELRLPIVEARRRTATLDDVFFHTLNADIQSNERL